MERENKLSPPWEEANLTDSPMAGGDRSNSQPLGSCVQPPPAHPSTLRRKPVPGQAILAANVPTERPKQYVAINTEDAEDEKDTNPKPTRASRYSGFAGLFLWRWELLSLLISVGSFIAIVIILHLHQDKTLSSWNLPISLNALIAILSAVFKASLALPISEGISQLKWLWFSSQPRSLADMDLYDKASRGPWGSVIFIAKQFVRKQRSYLASLGAFIALITLAVDPFSQATIAFQGCLQPSSSPASIPRANTYTAAAGIGGATDLHPAYGPMQVAVYLGLLRPPPNSSVSVSVTCSTGNCTFPTDQGASFTTLTMCHSCKDISESVNVQEYYSYNLSSGLHVGQSDLFRTSYKVDTESYPIGPWKLTSLVSIQGLARVHKDSNCNGTQCIVPIAFDCSLRPCVKTYSANVTNATYYEEEQSREYLHNTFPGTPMGFYQLATNRAFYNGTWKNCQGTSKRSDINTELAALAPPELRNDTTYSGKQADWYPPESNATLWYPPECVYTLGNRASGSIKTSISDVFNDSRVEFDTVPDQIIGSVYLQNIYKKGKMNFTSIDHDMESLATSIGAQLRQDPADPADPARLTSVPGPYIADGNMCQRAMEFSNLSCGTAWATVAILHGAYSGESP